tara:strand:+ start:12593 stop:14176 length:1584 start_codon:yes stop_codon:yes gene_type:complete
MTKKILFSTQDSSVKMFYELSKLLKDENKVSESAFTVTNSQFYDNWISKNTEFEKLNKFILKEWELNEKSKKENLDINLLKGFEIRLGINPGLFGGIVSDRRLFMGYKNTYSQDYKRRFNDENLLKIIQLFLREIDNLFNKFNPDIVVSFQCVTLIDYLLALFAREKKIRYLNLRPTKINNRVMFASTVNDPPPEISKFYDEMINHNGSDYDYENINSFISKYRKEMKLYEGVVLPSLKPTNKINFSISRIGNLKSFLFNIFNFYRRGYFKDNQITNPILRAIYIGFLNPLRARKINNFLKRKYIDQKQLSKMNYIFFPMHTEPEVSLLVHGKPFINQIELIRMIALSMPIDTVLVIKEHPWMIGKRSLNSYKKILNIPRVKIARPDIISRDLIINARLLTVITSSISLEGIILKKPCITFGDCMTNLLPRFMCQRCEDIKLLPIILSEMMSTKIEDQWDTHLKCMLYSIFNFSKEVNLYTSLLGRKNRVSNNNRPFDEEVRSLYDCIINSLKCIEKYDYDKKSSIW